MPNRIIQTPAGLTAAALSEWIAGLDTAAAMDIIADALELTINNADMHNGGDCRGEHYHSDMDAIASVRLDEVSGHRKGNYEIDVFDVVDAARARLSRAGKPVAA